MQQVNLYTDDFRPKKVLLPLEHILGLMLLAVVLLIPVSALLFMSLDSSQEELSSNQKKADDMRARVALLEKRASLLVRDESLAQANQRLAQQIEARERMISMLDQVVVRDDEGFSHLLEALARQNMNELWLTRIVVGVGGKQMMLEGQTSSAEAVPKYLQRLRGEDAFIGRTFTLFDLKTDEDKSRHLNFRLRSQQEASTQLLLTAESVSDQNRLMNRGERSE